MHAIFFDKNCFDVCRRVTNIVFIKIRPRESEFFFQSRTSSKYIFEMLMRSEDQRYISDALKARRKECKDKSDNLVILVVCYFLKNLLEYCGIKTTYPNPILVTWMMS